jgi:hypothetical protein
MTNPQDNPDEWADVVEPDGSRYSFCEFHPLDHQPWQPRCRKLPGGWRQHLRVWRLMQWHMRYRIRLLRRPHKLLCRLGHHDEYTSHHGIGGWTGFYVGCNFCSWRRPATEDEWFHFPGDGGVLGGTP